MKPDIEDRRSRSLDWVLVLLAVLLAIRIGAAIVMRSQFTSALVYGAM
jgi:hypothetical protein